MCQVFERPIRFQFSDLQGKRCGKTTEELTVGQQRLLLDDFNIFLFFSSFFYNIKNPRSMEHIKPVAVAEEQQLAVIMHVYKQTTWLFPMCMMFNIALGYMLHMPCLAYLFSSYLISSIIYSLVAYDVVPYLIWFLNMTNV